MCILDLSLFISSLRELVKLELRECEIENISQKTFVGLSKLEWLALDKNFLATVSHFPFLPLANLNSLDIHQNPWNCTCEMKPFIQVPFHFLFPSQNIPLNKSLHFSGLEDQMYPILSLQYVLVSEISG